MIYADFKVKKIKLRLKFIVVVIWGNSLFSASMIMAEDDELLNGVSISGLVQIEGRFNQDYAGNDSSDFVVDELGLGIEAQVHKFAKAQIAFIYEEGVTDLEIDEAFLILGGSESPLYLSVGQLYVPFGYFESQMVSDSLTLEIGEAREKVAQLSFETSGLHGSVYIFNGMTQDGAEDKIDHYGSNIRFSQETKNLSYDFGVSYISDIADSDGLSDAIGGDDGWPVQNYEYVDGFGAYISFNVGSINLIAEYVTALDKFGVEHLAFNGVGAKPKAWNVELGYTFNIAGKETILAIGYQGTAMAMELPETRLLTALSVGVYDNTTFSLEYAYDEDYDVSDGGTGKDAKNVILQLAVEF